MGCCSLELKNELILQMYSFLKMSAHQSRQNSIAGQDKIYAKNLDECRLKIKQGEDAGQTTVICPLLGRVYGALLEREGYNVILAQECMTTFKTAPYAKKSGIPETLATQTIVSWDESPTCPTSD